MTYGLSKSRLIEWRQCPKRLWLRIHRPELIEVSAETEQAFRVGYDVGNVARQLHPDGILIDADDLKEALSQTREVLTNHSGVPIFEATFERDGVLVRADLLLPEPGGYRLVEVKSAASIKDYYLEDAAIQRWVTEASIALTGVDLSHVDNQFVYPGGGDYQGLFKRVSVEDETAGLGPEIPIWIAGARNTLAGGEPEIECGSHCAYPFECPFIGYCEVDQSVTEYPLSALPHLHSSKRVRLDAMGIADIRQVPEDFPLTDNQARVRRVTLSGNAELLPSAAHALNALPWPRYYIDFETVRMAVPIWAGSRPYQQLPVQWSCHVEQEDGRLDHHFFLADSLDDPRRAFAESLIAATGDTGPVFVYNQSFELSRLEELARDLPDLASGLQAIAQRVVDLLPLTRDSYYHPAMLGSWSIKGVLKSIDPELDYSLMEIGDGAQAEDAWHEILHPDTPEERRSELKNHLAGYCKLDTFAMVILAKFLTER